MPAESTKTAGPRQPRARMLRADSGAGTHAERQRSPKRLNSEDVFGKINSIHPTGFPEAGNETTQRRVMQMRTKDTKTTIPDGKSARRSATGLFLILAAVCVSGCATESGSNPNSPTTLDGTVSNLLANMVFIPSQDAYVASFEVTQREWTFITGDDPIRFRTPEGWEHPDNPAFNLSFDDCMRFVAAVNGQPQVRDAGLVFRLPASEQEWQEASRAGTQVGVMKMADGHVARMDDLRKIAWTAENSGGRVHPVGRKAPNAFGLFDTQGNVREWTMTDKGSPGWMFGGSIESKRPDKQWAFGFAGFGWNPPPNDPKQPVKTAGVRLWADTKEKAEKVRQEREKEIFQARKNALNWHGETKKIRVAKGVSFDMISVPEDIWFGKFEVSQAVWKAVMGENPSFTKGSDHPVENVSFDDCREFIKRLNEIPSVRKTGLEFRLPSTVEWKAACLSGSLGDYCMLADGTCIDEKNVSEVAFIPSFKQETMFKQGVWTDYTEGATEKIGQRKPNAWGLHDMHGNVAEWTWFGKSPDAGKYKACGLRHMERTVDANSGELHMDALRLVNGVEKEMKGSEKKNEWTGFRLCAEKRK